MDMINFLYKKMYNIIPLRVSPADQGHAGVARERLYRLILTLKGLVEEVFNPKQLYDEISQYISKHIKTEPKDYLVSTPREYFSEAMRTARERGIKLRTLKVSRKVINSPPEWNILYYYFGIVSVLRSL